MSKSLSAIFPKSHPIDRKMRPVVVSALVMARRTMPITAFQYPAHYRNNLVKEIAGERLLKILKVAGRQFGIGE